MQNVVSFFQGFDEISFFGWWPSNNVRKLFMFLTGVGSKSDSFFQSSLAWYVLARPEPTLEFTLTHYISIGLALHKNVTIS